MNSAYLYDTKAASCAITNRIYYLLETRHWSVKTLSDESNIPYETLKKLLSRKTENTSFHNIMKIALAFDCNLNEFLESPGKKENFPGYYNEVETSLDFCTSTSKVCKIPILSPNSSYDKNTVEYIFTNSTMDSLTLSCHTKQNIEYGIRITSFCYHPVYQYGDILLISRDRAPHSGEIGIFLHQNRLHIRAFYKVQNYIFLKAVNHLGPDIKIYDFSEWNILGYVAGIQRIR